VIGTKTVAGSRPPLYCGADIELQLSDGTRRAVGVRSGALYQQGSPERDLDWDDGYVPIATDLDLGTVRFWDFSEILWLGPEPRPCIMWSNATGFTDRGLDTILELGDVGAMLRGRRGQGLPLVSDVVSLAR
jgi:hypothetical protein